MDFVLRSPNISSRFEVDNPESTLFIGKYPLQPFENDEELLIYIHDLSVIIFHSTLSRIVTNTMDEFYLAIKNNYETI